MCPLTSSHDFAIAYITIAFSSSFFLEANRFLGFEYTCIKSGLRSVMSSGLWQEAQEKVVVSSHASPVIVHAE